MNAIKQKFPNCTVQRAILMNQLGCEIGADGKWEIPFFKNTIHKCEDDRVAYDISFQKESITFYKDGESMEVDIDVVRTVCGDVSINKCNCK